MPDENPNPEGGAQPEAVAEETFTLTRAQLDEFKARTLAEVAPAAPAQPAAPKMDPLAAYYAGVQGRAQQQAAKQPQAPAGESSLDRVAKLMEMQLMQTMMPKPPPPPKVMTVEEKLATRDADVMLGKGPNGWTRADGEALRAKHRNELAKAGFKGDIEGEARARAARETMAAFEGLAASVKVNVR